MAGEPYFEIFARTCKNEKARDLIMLMKTADEACDLFEHCGVDCLLELMFLGVLPEYWNRHFGEELTNVTVEVASRLSLGENVKVSVDNSVLSVNPVPKLVAALFTSPRSQRVGDKCKFEVATRISYENFHNHGKTFASVLDEGIKDITLSFKRL